jgi:HD superfamily phosphohydrolase
MERIDLTARRRKGVSQRRRRSGPEPLGWPTVAATMGGLSSEPKRQIYLDLYGPIVFESPDDDLFWELFQTEAFARLREISLSATPSAFAPHGVALSRFQHSVAVGFLARKLCDRRPSLRPYQRLLVTAGLCHDLGSPCFSHTAEIFSYALTGRTHEQETMRVLDGRGEVGRLLRRFAVDPREVVQLITGDDEHPLSPLIAGSLDLDNISNSQDLLRSLGYRDELLYHPLKLVEAFRFREGRVVLDSSYLAEMLGWAEARRKLYGLLYSESNLSASVMLYRAIEFAFARGAVDIGFFRLSEPDALSYLRHEVGGETSSLIRDAYQWRHYPCIFERHSREEDMRLVSLYDDWRLRKEFTDRIADELGLKPVELTLHVGRDRGEKAITLPFVGEHAEAAAALFSGSKGRQRLSLFAHPRHVDLRHAQRVVETVDRCLCDLPEAPAVGHVFS